MNWLDTQTKEILQKAGEPKPAPPKTAEFALVLIRKGNDRDRLVRAISRINECDEAQANLVVARRAPITINPDLTEEDALWGQFELICCDAISIFFRTEVLEQMDSAYLQSLYNKTSQSTEFQPTVINIAEVPDTDSGRKFIDQFLGSPESISGGLLPCLTTVPFKKARIMQHWATRVGAKIEYHLK